MKKLWPVALTVCLCACADTTFQDSYGHRAAAPFFFIHEAKPTAGEEYLRDEDRVFRPMETLNLAEREDELRYGGNNQPRLPAGCSFKDRFDNDSALAYNFDDQQSRLSLHVDGDMGFGGFDVEQVMVKYRFRLQKDIARSEDACRYPSQLQGLLATGYNEFFVRERDTVWDEFRDKNPFAGF